ncbi:MAG: right-handed parallel beta-helix repeat-containing protein [Treponema sp.]|nr:right-handed parallel beta-helix repeat-containing protein [Treponema sp.]
MNTTDPSALLPNGNYFDFWDDKTDYKTFLYVDGANPIASDVNPGDKERPFKTINAAAQVATPGVKVIIRGGEYRETVKPAQGGSGPEAMIAYEAAPGEKVIIKASVVARHIKLSEGWRFAGFMAPPNAPQINAWEITLEPEDHKGYNPWNAINLIHDRTFIEYDKTDMTPYLNRRGMVFVDGKPLKQVPVPGGIGAETGTYWVESNGQKIHVRLPNDEDPKDHLIELSAREQCFAPDTPFLAYIHLKDLICAHAATGAPVPQRGSISCYRGHHWIIEGCTIDWSNGVGIDAGNECWHHGFNTGNIVGYDIIRGCEIRDVGVCGIAAMGTTGLLVEDNLIYGTGWQRMELSWEAGGIKVHNACDGLFRRNIIAHTIGCDSIWMDVGNHNSRLTGNLLIDGIDSREHIFIECTRDQETMIDNNIIWNVEGRYDRSKIKAFAGSAPWYRDVAEEITNGYGIYCEGTDRLRISNNLIGRCNNSGYFAKTVAFRLHGRGGTSRLNKFYNNIFYDCGEAAIKMTNIHNEAEGNAYARMPFTGGYLRVLYPAPSMCLDLPSWQEFCGFDKDGCIAGLSIDINSETYEMSIEVQQALPLVTADPKSNTDYFTDAAPADKRIAGPFPKLPAGKTVISIDPRRYGKAATR